MLVQEWVKNVTSGKLSKADKLGTVDHSKVGGVRIWLSTVFRVLLAVLITAFLYLEATTCHQLHVQPPLCNQDLHAQLLSTTAILVL
jgi:hypothetical protein